MVDDAPADRATPEPGLERSRSTIGRDLLQARVNVGLLAGFQAQGGSVDQGIAR